MNREMKKQKLKQRMVSSEPQRPPDSGTGEMPEELVQYAKKIRKRRLTIFLTIAIILMCAAAAFYQYQKYYQFTDYSVVWEKKLEHSEGNFVQYLSFGSNVLRYSKDGASYIDSSGKVVWMQSYEMKAPIAVKNGDYAAVADQMGNKIYIFNLEGTQGTATTLLPVVKVVIARNGVTAVILEDAKSEQITMFRKDGTQLDIAMKSLLEGDVGYPLDISISPNATQLVGSYVYFSAGELKNRVAFYDFSEVGKNYSNRFIAGFDDVHEASLAAQVLYLRDDICCSISDTRLLFYSLQKVDDPGVLKEILIEEEIRTTFYSDRYVGLIVNTHSGEKSLRMDIYEIGGRLVLSKEFDHPYTKAEIDGDYIILYDNNSCYIYNFSGTLKFQHTFNTNIIKIRSKNMFNHFMVIGSGSMQEIKLQ